VQAGFRSNQLSNFHDQTYGSHNDPQASFTLPYLDPSKVISSTTAVDLELPPAYTPVGNADYQIDASASNDATSSTQVETEDDASRLSFATLVEAKQHKDQRQFGWSPLEDDDTLPTTDSERQTYVKLLRDAMLDMSLTVEDSDTFHLRWIPYMDNKGDLSKLHYEIEHMEILCWTLVDMAEQYHLHGMSTLPIYDPGTVKASKKYRNLPFRDRLEYMAELLKTSKYRIDTLMKGESLETFMTTAPEKGLQSIRNRQSNGRKAITLAIGKEHEKDGTAEPKPPKTRRRRAKKTERQNESSVVPAQQPQPATLEDGVDAQNLQALPGNLQVEDHSLGEHRTLPACSTDLCRDTVQQPSRPEHNKNLEHRTSHYSDLQQHGMGPNFTQYGGHNAFNDFRSPSPYHPKPDVTGQMHSYNEQTASECHPSMSMENTQAVSPLIASVFDSDLDPALLNGILPNDPTTGMWHVSDHSSPRKRSRRDDEHEVGQLPPSKHARH
jgi:hypothetical protein